MTENIELQSFHTNNGVKDSDIEEYHEINLNDVAEHTIGDTHSLKSLNEYDFFSQNNTKAEKNGSTKKKKIKRKEKASNLMDIITSELASIAVPIEENVISRLECTAEQRSSYLEMTPRVRSIFDRRPVDYEQGRNGDKISLDLKPTFPRVLENISVELSAIPVEYVKPGIFNDLLTENYTQEQQEAKFIDIEIKDIKFKHHHHFSLEKLLSIKLNEYFHEYSKLKSSLTDIVREIKVNRETRDNLKQEFIKISPNKKDDIRFDQTIRKYTKTLLDLKEKYIKTLQLQRELIHKIWSLWSDIEMIREKTENTDTDDILIVTHRLLDEEEYEKEWNEVFNKEYHDMLDKMEYEYVNKYIEYKEVKYIQNLDDSAKRRISKPKLQIDEEVLKEEVEEIVNSIVMKDQINIDLKHDTNILSESSGTEKSKYINFEIYVDDVRVCESEHFISKNSKTPDIEFTDALSVQILPKNSTLGIILLENDKEVSALRIDLADIRKNNNNAEFVTQTFTYHLLIEPTATHVGSGHNIKEIASQNKVRLKSSNIFKGNLYSACDVKIKMGWNEKTNQNQAEAMKASMEIGRQIKRLIQGIDKPTTDTLADIISKVYNKDVRNEQEVLTSLRRLSKMDTATEDTFPIDANSPEFTRLKLLHLRNNGGMTDVENKRVPIHASQISTEHLNCLQKSNETDIDVQYFHDKYNDMDPIELQRFVGAKYLQKLNKNMLKNLNEHLLRKTHKDVVRDFQDLSLRNLFSKQSNLTLANISNSAKQQILVEALGREQEIRITVLRAFNLPDRNALIDEIDEDQIAGFKLRSLRPLVRVSYNGVSAQSVVAIGCHPSWSQTLKITAKPNPLSLIQINVFDEHKTTLPDGSDSESGRSVHYRYCNRWLGGLQIPLHTVLSLGTYRGTFRLTVPPMLFGYENKTQNKNDQSVIPAVTQLMKKDVSFVSLQITTSLSHLGGLHGYNQPIPSEDDYLINHLNAFVTQYINDFPTRSISLTFIDSSGRNKCVTQFLQPIPLPDPECFPKNPKSRSESALSKSSVSKSSSSKSSSKRRESGVSYQSGEERESLYSTISWKNGDNQLEKVMTAIARYVALIPVYDVAESYTVTLMGSELLKVVHGSPLDHTILLASYFLYIGVRCWVAIGLGLPRGRSSYVLTKYDMTARRPMLLNDPIRSRSLLSRSEGCIWYVHDAVSGDKSELRDVSCPLKNVEFVFDNENIWVNVQASLDCESTSFDFARSSDWQPVFDKSIFVMKQPVLSDPGLYSNAADTERLRMSLEMKIKEKVQKWRSHMKTIWNRYCSSLLKEMLPHWEYWSFNPSEQKPRPSQRLKQLMVTYKVFGFPLNTSYVNTKSVLTTVKSTGAHLSVDPNVEFGVAVEVYAYPNNVLSVWVFLANITRL
ncbi:hypothetical protein O0L34_g16630 [Tuta absoluta]|nr:hypothetical protein O0L34_g16630 [Tuta absoluta]